MISTHRGPPEAREASPLTGNAIPCRFTPKCPRRAVRGSSQFRHGQIGDEGLDFFFAGLEADYAGNARDANMFG